MNTDFTNTHLQEIERMERETIDQMLKIHLVHCKPIVGFWETWTWDNVEAEEAFKALDLHLDKLRKTKEDWINKK